jgi:peptide-methionine (S)-S-oxide reductase
MLLAVVPWLPWALSGVMQEEEGRSGVDPRGGAEVHAEAQAAAQAQALDTAYFAGGCFWCMEPPFDAIEGVLSTTSGFMGGSVENPTYAQVTSGNTGHAEVVEVIFDRARISYGQLLQVFWVNIDPLDAGGQFCDRGDIYRSEIFYLGDEQGEVARASLLALERSGRFQESIVTRVTAATAFYPAEEYHQGYYLKNPVRYRVYRTNCGRDRRLRQLWGDLAPY